MDEKNNIEDISRIIWKRNLSKNTEHFSNLINDQKVFDKYFNESYLEKLSQKSKELMSIIIKLSFVYTIIMISLFASINSGGSEFQIFGYSFKNLEKYKEFLLFFAAVISPFSIVLSAYRNYLNSLIDECIKRITLNSEIRKFYTYKYMNKYFDGWTYITSKKEHKWHSIAIFLMFMLVLILFILFMSLMIVSFLIQINVIYDLIKNPSSSHFINLFVVFFAIVSILFSWTVTVIQLPLPEVDNSNSKKLIDMEKNEPEKYKETMKKIAMKSAKKEARNLIVLYAIVYTMTFSIISIIFYPNSLADIENFLSKAIPGAFVVMFFSNQLLGFIFNRSRIWFFKKYSEDSLKRLTVFIRMERILLSIKFIIPFIGSVIYSFYIFNK